MPLKRAHLHHFSQILWCGLAHVQADRSPGPGLLLNFTDVRASANDRFAPEAVIPTRVEVTAPIGKETPLPEAPPTDRGPAQDPESRD
jgi:hypothetical protein